jgi:hypothetical protein
MNLINVIVKSVIFQNPSSILFKASTFGKSSGVLLKALKKLLGKYKILLVSDSKLSDHINLSQLESRVPIPLTDSQWHICRESIFKWWVVVQGLNHPEVMHVHC